MDKPPTALVVDSSEQIRILLTAFLRRSGFAVETARDIDSAIARLRGFDFDVVIVDPSACSDGKGLSRLAGSFPAVVRRTVVMASRPHGGVEEPVHTVIEKPFELEALLEAVSTCSKSRSLHHM